MQVGFASVTTTDQGSVLSGNKVGVTLRKVCIGWEMLAGLLQEI
jgi:hypothetical protein